MGPKILKDIQSKKRNLNQYILKEKDKIQWNPQPISEKVNISVQKSPFITEGPSKPIVNAKKLDNGNMNGSILMAMGGNQDSNHLDSEILSPIPMGELYDPFETMVPDIDEDLSSQSGGSLDLAWMEGGIIERIAFQKTIGGLWIPHLVIQEDSGERIWIPMVDRLQLTVSKTKYCANCHRIVIPQLKPRRKLENLNTQKITERKEKILIKSVPPVALCGECTRQKQEFSPAYVRTHLNCDGAKSISSNDKNCRGCPAEKECLEEAMLAFYVVGASREPIPMVWGYLTVSPQTRIHSTLQYWGCHAIIGWIPSPEQNYWIETVKKATMFLHGKIPSLNLSDLEKCLASGNGIGMEFTWENTEVKWKLSREFKPNRTNQVQEILSGDRCNQMVWQIQKEGIFSSKFTDWVGFSFIPESTHLLENEIRPGNEKQPKFLPLIEKIWEDLITPEPDEKENEKLGKGSDGIVIEGYAGECEGPLLRIRDFCLQKIHESLGTDISPLEDGGGGDFSEISQSKQKMELNPVSSPFHAESVKFNLEWLIGHRVWQK